MGLLQPLVDLFGRGHIPIDSFVHGPARRLTFYLCSSSHFEFVDHRFCAEFFVSTEVLHEILFLVPFALVPVPRSIPVNRSPSGFATATVFPVRIKDSSGRCRSRSFTVADLLIWQPVFAPKKTRLFSWMFSMTENGLIPNWESPDRMPFCIRSASRADPHFIPFRHRARLWPDVPETELVTQYFGNPGTPIILSNDS